MLQENDLHQTLKDPAEPANEKRSVASSKKERLLTGRIPRRLYVGIVISPVSYKVTNTRESSNSTRAVVVITSTTILLCLQCSRCNIPRTI